MVNYRKIITINSEVRSGKPCIRNLRITIYDILGWMASGMSKVDILEGFPELKEEDILAALAYAAEKEKGTITAA